MDQNKLHHLSLTKFNIDKLKYLELVKQSNGFQDYNMKTLRKDTDVSLRSTNVYRSAELFKISPSR